MLFTDEDLFGPQPQQLDMFEPIAEIQASAHTTNSQAAPVSDYNVGDGIRYHGSQVVAHGDGYVVAVERRGRLTIRVRTEDFGVRTIRHVRYESVSPLTPRGVDYGDEPGHIDLFGAGQLTLVGV